MGNDSYPLKLTASATTTLGSVMVYAISINKALTGTLTIDNDTTRIAGFVATTPVGTYHVAPNGARYSNFKAGLSTTDDVTVFTRAV